MTLREHYECDHDDCDEVSVGRAPIELVDDEGLPDPKTRHLCNRHKAMLEAWLRGEAVIERV